MPKRRQHGEGSVFQRTRDGRWVARADLGWKDGRRDQRLFVAAGPEEAIEKRRKFLDARRDGFTPPKGRPATVAEWMRHWLHNVARREVQPTTWHGSYRQKTEELICPYFEHIALPDLTEEDIEDWHAQLEARVSKRTGRPLSAATIGQCHRIMSRALKVAVVRKRIGRNPCSNVSPPSADRERPVLPSAADVERILDRCETWPNGARWILAITTGIRQGEALGLEWQYVRLEPPAALRVEWSAAQVQGERVRKPPKSRSSRRPVPLPARGVAALAALKAGQQVRDLSGIVFTDAAGRPVHPRADWQDWCNLLDDLGLPHYRVHGLRHVYATMLLEQGIDRRIVQDLMGHSSAALLDVYQDVRPVMHQLAADALDRALGPGR